MTELAVNDKSTKTISFGTDFMGRNLTYIQVLKWVLILFLVVFSAVPANSQTYIIRDITTDTTLSLEGSPYYIDRELIVGPSESEASTVTLVVEPGVQIRSVAAEIVGGLTIGPKGILIAQGTENEPVVFDRQPEYSSNWQGIKFSSDIEITDSIIENCIIQNAVRAIDYEAGSVRVLSNVILSNSTGINYSSVGPSFNLIIECNHIKDNFTGIYCNQGNVYGQVRNNVFEGNYHNIYGPQGSNGSFYADQNYFVDGYIGVIGNVYVDPQLSSWPGCAPDFSNSPPNTPLNPNPTDGATNVEGNWDGSWRIALSWECSDPDQGDILEYRINYGTDPNNLTNDVVINEPTWILGYLLPSTTYYWRVTAIDQLSAETVGPIWQFTTAASPIDLTPTEITWTPETNILGNDLVTFTAVIQKTGEATTGGYFTVDFRIDGESIGTSRLGPGAFDANQTAQAVRTWPAQWGQHTVEVFVDTASEIYESDETNNTLSVALPEIIDPDPPIIESTNPSDNQYLQEVNTVNLTMRDVHGEIDADAVRNAIIVTREGGGVEGAITDTAAEDSITLTFTPSVSPFPDGNYDVSFSAIDTAGNTADHTFTFTVDSIAPAAPVVDPVTSPTNNASPVITGTKGAYDAIWLNGQMIVGYAMGTTWQYTASLVSGANTFSFTASDRAGNVGPPTEVTIVFDDISPLPVDTLTVNGEGSGTRLVLNWSGYDESAHGDIDHYRIYIENAPFSDTTGLTPVATVPSGVFAYNATGLTRDTTYWCAVVAVDDRGNARSGVTPVSATTSDVNPPEEVTNLNVQSFSDHLVFTWSASANSAGDLAGYRVYFNNATTPVELTPAILTYEATGLSPASAYPIRVTTFDDTDNESTGRSRTGHTWLPNPTSVTAEPLSAMVRLNWSAVGPASSLLRYNIYVSTSNFGSVEGMSPAVTTGATTANVAGLTNGTPYYFAVTAVNRSNGMDPDVATVTATPQLDNEGPTITDVQVNGSPVTDGMTLTRSSVFSAGATDQSGVSRVIFSIDGSPIQTDFNAPYSAYWDIVSSTDGGHILTVTAFDTLDNETSVSFTINVALAVPEAPTITQPSTGISVNDPNITVAGQAEKNVEVLFHLNGSPTGLTTKADAAGNYSGTVTLTEGVNRIRTSARNRAGEGPLSNEVLVTLDTSLPDPPTGVSATSQSGGTIRLAWQRPAEAVEGYHIYRATSAFADPVVAERLTTTPIQSTGYEDLPAEDGIYYYRITSVDDADNESDPSALVQAVSDRELPKATSIVYTPQGAYDAASGRMAPGRVDLVLTVSEPLLTTPFLSITPEGGIPLSVELFEDSETQYHGYFIIADTAPTGPAYAVFSARDKVGNRGTDVDAGTQVLFDTQGPQVTRLTTQPATPIRTNPDTPVSVIVTMGLNEEVADSLPPSLSYQLSGAGRVATEITNLTQISEQEDDVQTWQGSFVFPADAGQAAVETFTFAYSGTDDLGNVSEDIEVTNRFEVYQNDLPPLDAPTGLTAEALSGGHVHLTWQPVEGASGYRIYRQAPGETELTAFQTLGVVFEYTDQTTVDGDYLYAVTALREANGQESESAQSTPVSIYADATAPQPPLDLTLELFPQGVLAQWQAPAYTETVTYSLYRSDQAEITDLTGLTPIITGIEGLQAIDPTPSLTEHSYAVVAVDAAGNISPPSNSAYLNVELLPVASITVEKIDDASPVITWTHAGGSIAGYDIYLGDRDAGTRLNSDRLTVQTYTDTGFAGDLRQYTVVAIDTNDQESLGRTITLPIIEATPNPGQILRRGLMNRLVYQVENNSNVMVENIRLQVQVGGQTHPSQSFDLDPLAGQEVYVVIGGYADLEDIEILMTTVEVTPNPSEKVNIIRAGEIEVQDGSLVAQIIPESFTRGGTGQVRFSLENTGDETIEIVTATNNGTHPSPSVTFTLEDPDGNVLSSAECLQALGDNVITLPNRSTVARIPAGATFTSDSIGLTVPSTSPETVIVRLNITEIHYHLGQNDHVQMQGINATHAVNLIETTYIGEITTVSPESTVGGQEITITGQAVTREDATSVPNAALILYVFKDGFEQQFDVITDGTGQFTHTYTPPEGQSGVFNVRAMHPDLTERPIHATFTISSVIVTPPLVNLRIPKNYEQAIPVKAETGEGATVANLRLSVVGVLPTGVHVELGEPVVEVGPETIADLPLTIWADNTANETSTFRFRVISDENLDPGWGDIFVNAQFSEALPALYFTPSHVETGLARGDLVTETITLENRGLAPMTGVQLSLVDSQGDLAPDWIRLNAESDIGTIEVGEQSAITLTFAPTDTTPENNYTFYLRVTSTNHPQRDIGLFVVVTQSGIGSALFKVADIYTGTLDDEGNIVQGLADARITLQNEAVISETFNMTTDSFGEALFTELAAGRYKYRITANNHQEAIGRLWVRPGITATEEVFLQYNLVTVEWEVNEITLEDRYEIILTATFETDVPAAVLVAEPQGINLPSMEAGSVYHGEFSLTNYGLIRLDNLELRLPADDQYFNYELLPDIPDHLNAKDRITVAYRVTCIKPPGSDEEQDGTGGGCGAYSGIFVGTGNNRCPSGHLSNTSTSHTVYYSYGICSGSSGGGYIGFGGGGYGFGWGGYGGSGYGGGGTSFAGTPPCLPDPPDGPGPGGGGPGGAGGGGGPGGGCGKGICCGGAGGGGGESEREDCCEDERCDEQKQCTGSFVNTLRRDYTLDITDLGVKVPGGYIRASRSYSNGNWQFSNGMYRLDFELDTIDDLIVAINWNNAKYEGSRSNTDIYTFENYQITRQSDDTYRWESLSGEWKTFDTEGRMLSFGDRNGTIGYAVYDGNDSDVCIGFEDRNQNRVINFEYDTDGTLWAISDTNDRRVEYGYIDGLLTRVTDVRGHDTTYEYDTNGRIEIVVYPDGRESHVSFNGSGYVERVVDADGNGYAFNYNYDKTRSEYYAIMTNIQTGWTKEIWYDRDGDTKRVDINGQTVKRIEEDGRNTIVTDAAGRQTRKFFDEWNKLTQVIYPDGTQINHEYDPVLHKRIRTEDENGVVTTYAYDDNGNMTSKVEAAGTDVARETTYEYDDENNLITTTRVGQTGELDAVTRMEYDNYGNMNHLTDPEGYITTFTHDHMGNVLTKTDAREKLWQYIYDSSGNLIDMIDPDNRTTHYEYDPVGRKILERDPLNREKHFEYDHRNNLTAVTDALGNTTRFEYTFDGKLLSQTDPEGRVTRFEYDAEGRMVNTIDAANNTIETVYDEFGGGCSSCSGGSSAEKPERIIYPTFSRTFAYDERGRKVVEIDVLSPTDLNETQYAYDATGRLLSKTDKENKTVYYEYDDLGRLLMVTAPASSITRYVYDGRDNLISLIDSELQETRFEYDLNNRLVKEIRPMGEETTYQYDGVGNLIEKIDAKNQKTEYVYDNADRLSDILYYTTAGDTTAAKTVTLTYDDLGNLAGYADGTTSAIYGYDENYRKVTEEVDYGDFTLSNIITYYNDGRKETFTGPDGVVYDYQYDEGGRLSGIQIPDVGFVTIGEYTWNRPATMTLPGGTQKTYAYDPLMRVQQITTRDPGANPLLDYSYGYDRMDNITTKTTEHGEYAYGYDDLYRLTTSDNPTETDEVFSYDTVGNRLTSTDTTNPWTYNQNNELGGYDDVSFEYDANGNMVKKTVGTAVTSYVYNIEDRMTEVWDGEVGTGSLTASYYYDPFGRRLWKEVSGVRTHFHYADEGLVGEYDAVGNEMRTYGYKPGSTWSTDPLFVKEANQYYFYHNDHLGTPQKLTAVSGAVVWSATYSSFGKAVVEVEVVENPLRFAGQYYDSETGLHYNWHRYYDPETGRYLTPDPIGLDGEDENYYAYVWGDPVNWFDFNGLARGKKGRENVRTTDGGTNADDKADGKRNIRKRENLRRKKPKSPKQKRKEIKDKRRRRKLPRLPPTKPPSGPPIIYIDPRGYCEEYPSDPRCLTFCQRFPNHSSCKCRSS